MSFYAKACLVIAGVALLGIPFSYFALSRQQAAAVEMKFEVLRTLSDYSSTDRRTVGRVYLKGTHPEKGEIETEAQIDPDHLDRYQVGQTVSGRYIETDKYTYAHIGEAATQSPYSAMPMFGAIAVVFGLLGFFLARRGGG